MQWQIEFLQQHNFLQRFNANQNHAHELYKVGPKQRMKSVDDKLFSKLCTSGVLAKHDCKLTSVIQPETSVLLEYHFGGKRCPNYTIPTGAILLGHCLNNHLACGLMTTSHNYGHLKRQICLKARGMWM
jgi:hypothetical protein